MKGRLLTNVPGTKVRLVYQVGDGPWLANEWQDMPVVSDSSFTIYGEVDLGPLTVPAVVTGTQRWRSRVEAYTVGGGEVYCDYMTLVPTSGGYGKARAPISNAAGLVSGYDNFTGTTAGNNLNGRTATLGGIWATSGVATDFQFADLFGGEQLVRATMSEATRRYAILGTVSYTDVRVQQLQYMGRVETAGVVDQGIVARWTDASNHARAYIERLFSPSGWLLKIDLVVAGVVTSLASLDVEGVVVAGKTHGLRVTAYASGRVIAEILDQAGSAVLETLESSSTVLATAGALASGKSGLFDMNTTTTAVSRQYDEFSSSVPPAEPVVVYSGRNMQIRYDDTIRQDSTGTYVGRPPSYRGSRFVIPPGTSRVLAKARRTDIEAAVDTNTLDSTQIQVVATPRGLAVPR